jgi:hypothetical protein
MALFGKRLDRAAHVEMVLRLLNVADRVLQRMIADAAT